MTATRAGAAEAAVGTTAAVILIALAVGLPEWARYLLLWSILLTAVIVSERRRRRAGPDVHGFKAIRLRFTWMDLLVGAFVGLSLRMVVIAIELIFVGHLTSSSSFFVVEHDPLWLLLAFVAPAIIAPFVEELFFRGLVLPAIGVNWIGIAGSALIFSALHLVNGFNLLTAMTTFVSGLAFGLLAARTHRLGAGITAHIVYNASLIAISEIGTRAAVGG